MLQFGLQLLHCKGNLDGNEKTLLVLPVFEFERLYSFHYYDYAFLFYCASSCIRKEQYPIRTPRNAMPRRLYSPNVAQLGTSSLADDSFAFSLLLRWTRPPRGQHPSSKWQYLRCQ